MKDLKRLGAIALGIALLFSVGTAYVPAADSTNNGAVTIQNFAFGPDTLTIPVGTTVTWTNKDSVSHTVTSKNGTFDSGALSQGQTFQFTFNAPGPYDYSCTLHRSMTAKIIVTSQAEDIQEFALIHSLNDLKIYPATLTVKKGVKVRLFNTATDGSHPTVAISSDEDGKNLVF